MIIITKESSTDEINTYWKDVLKYRMNFNAEVNRLKTIGLGFYASQLNFEKEEDRYKEHPNFLDFIENNKRPFGNKNIPESIIYNLGWDSQWVMRIHGTPTWVCDLADEVYRELINQLINSKKEILEKDLIWKLL